MHCRICALRGNTCVYTSNLTLEGKLVGKARVNGLVGSYLQDLEHLPTSRYLQDELVGKGLDLVGKSNTFARNSYTRLFHRGTGHFYFNQLHKIHTRHLHRSKECARQWVNLQWEYEVSLYFCRCYIQVIYGCDTPGFVCSVVYYDATMALLSGIFERSLLSRVSSSCGHTCR